MNSTVKVAERAIAVAAELKKYPHLPALQGISVYEDETVLRVEYAWKRLAEIKNVSVWAEAFTADVVISLSSYGSGDVSTRFELAGQPVRVSVSCHTAQAYEFGRVIQEPFSQDAPITVSAGRMLEVLAELAAEQAQAVTP